ncbi:MAG: 1,5-anhydro-D-fructose reductase [bacterium]|nr:1,5-anhydro-D-fructose reductase [bacterium]
MMGSKLRAVMVGCGGMSREWLKFLQPMEDVEIVGLVDIVEASARARAEESGLEGVFVGSNLSKALDSTKPDVVFDITVPEAHADVTITALEHGCHVLGEKPMADSLENARRMIEAARRAGRIYAVTQNRRYDSRIRRLRAYLQSGELGDITTVNNDFYIGAHFGGFRDRMEHVLLLDMAIHTFDAARFLMGADPLAVYCKDWNPRGSWYDHDASAVAIFEMSNGIIYTYRGSWCCEGLNTTWESDWRIQTSKGCARWDGGDLLVMQRVLSANGFHSELEQVQMPETLIADKAGGHIGVVREFLDCVRAGATPETTCEDNIWSLAMVLAAVESSERGERVEISV